MNPAHPPEISSAKPRYAPLFCLALLVLLFLLPSFSLHPDGLRFGPDVSGHFYPSKFFLQSSVRAGEFPLYNPSVFSGTPVPQLSSLYLPDLLLWLVWPVKSGIWLTQMAHLLLAAAGMYLLVRHYTRDPAAAMLAAVSFTFGSYFACRIFAGHLVLAESAVWLPWILLSGEKILERSRFTLQTILAAALLALSLLAGSVEIAFMNGLALGLRFVWELAPALKARDFARARVLILNGAVLLVAAVGLMAVALLPTLELIGLSARAGQGEDVLQERSLPLVNLLTLVIPDLLGSGALRNTVQGSLSVESAAYTGLAPLLLAVFAPFVRRDRLAWFYVALAVLAVFVALGANTPLARVVPGFGKLPAPYRFVFLWSFAVPVLAGFGAHRVGENALDPRQLRRFTGFVLGVAILAAALTTLYFVFREPILALARHEILARYAEYAPLRLDKLDGFYATQLRGLALWALCSALLFLLLLGRSRGGARGRAVFQYGVVALLVFDLGAQNLKYVQGTTVVDTDRRLGYEAFLAGDPELHRVLPLADAHVAPNAPLFHGFSSVVGYDSLYLKSYHRYLEVMEGGPPGKIDVRAPLLKNHRSPLVDRLNVKYVLSGKPLRDDALTLVHVSDPIRVYRKKTYAPRAVVFHRIESAPDDEAALARLSRMPASAPVALVTGDAAAVPARVPATPEPAPEVRVPGPNRRIARVTLAEPGLLVFSEVFLPGWRAIVDGGEARVVRTNYLFCGVPLSAGAHTVELVYAPRSLRAGALVTGATLAGIALLCLLGLTRRARR